MSTTPPREDIHELFAKVQAHPDFVFGTIFVTGDFPRGEVPEHFYSHHTTDALVERGNEMIVDECGIEDDQDEQT